MTNPEFLDVHDDPQEPLPFMGGLRESVHVFDETSILAINAALAARRPLLVRGEPGCGKSQLARAAAVRLKRGFVAHTVDAQTEPRDLLWTLDAVARLAHAQIAGLPGVGVPPPPDNSDSANAVSLLDEQRFVRPGPLWWAFDGPSANRLRNLTRIRLIPPYHPDDDWSKPSGAVVLIDEIDKADSSVPNGLLEALGSGRFEAPGQPDGVSMNPERPPLVVITTNGERVMPDAFLRRCLVLQIDVPSTVGGAFERYLVERGRAHFSDKECDADVLRLAAKLVADGRVRAQEQQLSAPGQAEFLDLVRAVCAQRTTSGERCDLLRLVARFAIDKHARDHH